MKALITSQFFCSYFYHSAVKNWEKIQESKSPEKYYYGITAILLFQATLESYINFVIYDHEDQLRNEGENIETLVRHTNIKKKWSRVPDVLVHNTFDDNAEPFLSFIKLVDLRNKLVHFKTKEINIEIEFPIQAGTLTGHVLIDIEPIAKAGRDTTVGMIRSLHNLLGTEPPKFIEGDEYIFSMKILSVD